MAERFPSDSKSNPPSDSTKLSVEERIQIELRKEGWTDEQIKERIDEMAEMVRKQQEYILVDEDERMERERRGMEEMLKEMEYIRKEKEVIERLDERAYGPYAYDLYKKALEDGFEEDSSIRINVVGNFGQGKTSLVRRIIRKDIKGIKSTNGIDITRYKCNQDESGSITYKENPGLDMSDIFKRITDVSGPSAPNKAKRDKCFEHKSVDTPKQLSETERSQLIKAVKNKQRHKSCNESTKRFDIWDFGGQYVFYATHMLFHSRKAIYLLVFNLSCGLTDIVPNDDEEDECCANMGQRTMEYYIRFWVNSIHSFVSNKDGSEPTIILVGTHLDKLKGDDRSKKRHANRYFDAVRALFKGKQAIKHIYYKDFPIDNKDAAEGAFDDLRNEILVVGQKFAKTTRVPAKWIQLEKSLYEYRAKKIVEFATIIEIDQKIEYPLSNIEQIKLFLKHQHDQGTLFFFDEEPISKRVVLDPQFLIDAFKRLVTARRFITNRPDVYEEFQTLTAEGKLEPTLIDKLWTHAGDDLFMTHRDTILWFLQKHRIISEAMKFDENERVTVGLGWYVVPSLLKDHCQVALITDFLRGKLQTEIQFVISFDNSPVVPTVYHRLIAAALGKWSIVKFRDKTLLFENMSEVRIDLEHAGLIKMNDRHIHLSILNLCPRRKVKGVIPDEFKRFAESIIMYEFRKFQGVTGQKELPYEQGYACNHESHGVFGGKTITTFRQDSSIAGNTCPDLESHPIDTAFAMSEWFQGKEDLEVISSENASDQTLSKLSQLIGENWEILGIALGLGKVKIDHIRTDNHTTAMRIYEMLRHCRERFPDKASVSTLVALLRSLPKLTVDWDGIRNIVDELNKSERTRLAQ